MDNSDTVIDKISKRVQIDRISKITVSSPFKKDDSKPFKAVISKAVVKNEQCFHISYYIGKQVTHENIPLSEVFEKTIGIMLSGFKQCFISSNVNVTVLMNKKLGFTVTMKENTEPKEAKAEHNHQKNYIIKDGEYIGFLHKLDIMNKDGKVLDKKQKKFRQINKFLEMVDDIEKYIPENGCIVDMGCGKSYLTFMLYHYFNNIKKKNITIKGFDLKSDVIHKCSMLAEQFGFDRLKFYDMDIAELDTAKEKVDMVITLHACDTATDYAMFHAVKWGCRVIMSVPCCQHELFYQIKNSDFDILLKHGILKERFSALMTDALRADLLEICGYKTSVMEFIDMEHTPKNIMIRGIKKSKSCIDKDKLEKYVAFKDKFSLNPSLYSLLSEYVNKK